MNSFFVAAKAILPITFVMALGFLTRQRHWIKDTSFKDMTWVVFHYCLPVSLFLNILRADFSNISDPKLFLFIFGMIFILIFGGMAVFSKVPMDDRKKGVLVHGLYRTNYVILGLPIVESVCGAGNTAVASLLTATVVPFFNISAVLVMQKYAGGKADLKATCVKLLKNPMIIGVIVALVFRLIGITALPSLLDDCVTLVNKMTNPLALFALGGSISAQSLHDNLKDLVLFAVLKLIVIPTVILGIAILLGYRGETLVTMLVLYGGPVAVASYPMAESMGLDGEYAAQCVLVSTMCVMVTMFLYISLFGMFGLL